MFTFASPFGPRIFLAPDSGTPADPAAPNDPTPETAKPKLDSYGRPVATEPLVIPETTKITMTMEELEAEKKKVRAAMKAELAQQAQKDKEAADREAAKEQGKWQELAQKEEEKRKAIESETITLKTNIKRNEVREDVREYLRQHHGDYVGAEKWILPSIEFAIDTAPEDITKRIKSAADAYVKDNPRTKSVATPPPGGNSLGTINVPNQASQSNRVNGRVKITGVASRY